MHVANRVRHGTVVEGHEYMIVPMAGTNPLISVIIPVKGDPDGLRLTLLSLMSIGAVEIIVIDGGSDEATLAAILEHEQSISYWETGLDSGISDAMNRGISVAQGVYVAILNAGDVWLTETLLHVTRAIEQNPAVDIFHGTLEFISASGRTHRVRPCAKRLHKRMYVFHPTMFVAKACYDSIGGYDTDFRLAMDSEWCHRAVAQGRSFYEIPETLARMALGGRSDTDYPGALREFRQSVLLHGLVSRFWADVYFLGILIGKWSKRRLTAVQSSLRSIARR